MCYNVNKVTQWGVLNFYIVTQCGWCITLLHCVFYSYSFIATQWYVLKYYTVTQCGFYTIIQLGSIQVLYKHILEGRGGWA